MASLVAAAIPRRSATATAAFLKRRQVGQSEKQPLAQPFDGEASSLITPPRCTAPTSRHVIRFGLETQPTRETPDFPNREQPHGYASVRQNVYVS
jgi:hypothetical protein